MKTARLSVVIERDSFAERFQDAMDLATANQGYVQTSSSRGGQFGSLVIRSLEPVRGDLSGAQGARDRGRERDGRGQEVTAENVDLQARLRIERARRTVLLRLMDEATTIEPTLRVQNALTGVQLRIEEIQGALDVLDVKVSEATIRVEIRERDVEPLEKDVRNPSIPGAFDRAIAGVLRGDHRDRRGARLPSDPPAGDRARGVPGCAVCPQTLRLITSPG